MYTGRVFAFEFDMSGEGMARKARERAESGVYYVRIDSLDKLIFIEDGDRKRLVDLFSEYASRDYSEIYAYCLLPERIHLVVKEGLDGIGGLVRGALGRYAVWYNGHYRRSGRLFADRFKSLPLESTEQMLDAMRYVVRATTERELTNYADIVAGRAAAELTPFIEGRVAAFFDGECAFRGIGDKVSDDELLAAARELLFAVGTEKLEAMEEHEYYAVLRRLLALPGASVGRLSRVCAISRRQLEKAAAEGE